MAVVHPFMGLRYSRRAGEIQSLVAPPYDVITPAQRDEFAAESPYNVVHITLPEVRPDDRSKYVKYARSAALLSEWRREGILTPEPDPVMYRYTQRFPATDPSHDLSRTSALTRTSVIVLLRVEPYANGVVLPHERTFPKHKEDRLRLLEATRAHVEEIFGLFEDRDGAIHATIVNAPVGEAVRVSTEDGVEHVLEPIEDAATQQSIASALADRKLWIADGHHRYETALAFREAFGDSAGVLAGDIAEDFMPIALCSMSDPGLVLLPTHRVVQRMKLSRAEAVARFVEKFDVVETHSSRLTAEMARAHHAGQRVFGVTFEGSIGYLLTPRDEATLLDGLPSSDSDRLRRLDVSVLHQLILENMLGLTSTEEITYTREPMEAIRAVDEGAAVAFLMIAPTVEDMRAIALGGERMPQKSTYYFPKILSGLVMWSLNDF